MRGWRALERSYRGSEVAIVSEVPLEGDSYEIVFLLAISEIWLAKYHLESGLNQRGGDARDFFVTQMPVVPRSKTSTGGVARSQVCRHPRQ